VSNTAFVVGLAVEGHVLLRALGNHDSGMAQRIACAGADTDRARQAARRLLDEGAGALVSFGIAGGLDPALSSGDLVLAESVCLPGGRMIRIDPAWRTACAALVSRSGFQIHGGTLLGSDREVALASEKRRLFDLRGAVAADMESHGVAEIAEAAAVPFLVVRVVADPANRTLPSAVLGSVDPNGRARPGLVAARICLRPWQIVRVLRLRRDLQVALSALGRLARLLGPDFSRPGLSADT
jgi:adenosylhomocysteine nucleosidase